MKGDGLFARFRAHRTRRLELRPYRKGDYAAWQRAWSSLAPARNEWDSGPRSAAALTKATFLRILAQQKKSRDGEVALVLGVFERKSGDLVGFTTVEHVVRGRIQSASIGYEVMNTHWGRGFGTEMARGLVAAALRDLELHRVEALINPRNRRSIAVAKKAGMRREGVRKKFHRGADGAWRDMVVFAVTEEDLG